MENASEIISKCISELKFEFITLTTKKSEFESQRARFYNDATDSAAKMESFNNILERAYILAKDALLTKIVPDGESYSFSLMFKIQPQSKGQNSPTYFYDNNTFASKTPTATTSDELLEMMDNGVDKIKIAAYNYETMGGKNFFRI